MTEVLSTTHTSFFVVLPHIIWDFHYNNVYTYLGLFPNHKTVACQVPLSKGFSRQEYWGGLLFPPPGDLPDPGIKPICLIFAGGFFITAPRGKLWLTHKSWLGNMGRISKHSTLQVNHQITPVAIATVNAFRSFSAQSHSVSYPVIKGSIDYTEPPASFFDLEMPSQFSGHFLFHLSSVISPLSSMCPSRMVSKRRGVS